MNTALREWISDGPRRAGVMATGMGGTNAHLVLEEAPPAGNSNRAEEPDLLVWSARTESGLEQSTRQLSDFLLRNESINLTDVADTLQDGRRAFRHRRFAICRDRAEALRALGDASSRKSVFWGSHRLPKPSNRVSVSRHRRSLRRYGARASTAASRNSERQWIVRRVLSLLTSVRHPGDPVSSAVCGGTGGRQGRARGGDRSEEDARGRNQRSRGP